MKNNNKLFYGFALIFLAGVIFYIGKSISDKNSFSSSSSNNHTLLQDSLSITGVTSISNSGTCDVEIIPSDIERVVFYYDKKYYENISSFKGTELNIDFNSINKKLFSWNNTSSSLLVKVYVKTLQTIKQDGVGSIECKNSLPCNVLTIDNDGVGSIFLNVQAQTITVNNSGVGSVDIEGNTINATLNNDGTGSIESEKLMSKTATVNNSGVGSVSVHASDTLSLTNTGVGGIDYSGTAIISKIQSEGVGTISKQN